MAKCRTARFFPSLSVISLLAVLFLQGCSGSGGYGGGGGGNPPAAPTGLTATAGTGQVALSWTASSGATSYNVKRGTATGGPYTTVSSPATTSYTDTGVTGGTKYFYVVTAVNSNGESGNSNEASATPTLTVPAAPTGLAATAGDKQVALTWNASSGATGYNVKRGAAHGGPYPTVVPTAGTSYTDTGLTDGTTYYYVVTAVNTAGESGNSNEASATPMGSSASVHVTVDVLTNRHLISPYVYGGAFPQDAPTITDSGLSVVRWGGNAASTYNWQLFTDNADNDFYFEDFTFCGLGGFPSNGPCADSDSTQFVKDVQKAGGNPIMTMVMLPWVAKSAEVASPPNGHWSFSISKYGAQCGNDSKYNPDAGNGLKTDCSTRITGNDPNDAYFQLLADNTQTCNTPGTCVYRKDWATALATAFGTGPHFYNMDNEIDIWGGTHFDIHPNPATFNELRDTYLTEARNLKTWDPAATALGPVSCCWYFYWRSDYDSKNKNADVNSHGGVDFLPWWLNEVAWSDAVAGTRSLDVFDIHAYPDADTSSLTPTQLKALAVSIYRDWWDPTFPSAAAYIRSGGFSIEPIDSHPFRIPRMRALVNQIYPGTQFSITEWSAEFNGAADFSTALGDADAYGVLGRERVYLSTRWTAPLPVNPNYLALKLYTNYDGSHHGFAPMSVSATNDGDPNLFSSYAALNSTGAVLTLMVLNKDPANSVTAQLNLNGFTPTSVATYTLAASAPTTITKATPAWSSTMTFAPYSATLLVVSGTMASTPASEWDLNPDTIMVPAGGTVTLQPKLVSGTAQVTLGSAAFDSFEGAAACSGSLSITNPTIAQGTTGAITVNAGNTPGFCHFTVTGTDSGATQTQGGWIVVGNPAASLTKTSGDNQTGTHGTTLPQALTVTLTPGSSGGTAAGASVLFTTSGGSLSNGTTSGSKVIAVTNSTGVASVTLTLPSTTGQVTVTAEGPYGLGHPVPSAPFTETSQ